MSDVVVIVACFAFVIIQQIIHHKERKDLYNRIMSRDATDYKKLTEDKPPKESRQQALYRQWVNK